MTSQGSVRGPALQMYVHEDEYSVYPETYRTDSQTGKSVGLSLGCGGNNCMKLNYADSDFAFKTQRFNQCNVNPARLASCAQPNYNVLTGDYTVDGKLVKASTANGYFTYDSGYGTQCSNSEMKLNSEGKLFVPPGSECGENCGFYTNLTACNSNLNTTQGPNRTFNGTCGN
jgi:hypothetical protein